MSQALLKCWEQTVERTLALVESDKTQREARVSQAGKAERKVEQLGA